jgi:tetratricopeptide (TPR) repeat protein
VIRYLRSLRITLLLFAGFCGSAGMCGVSDETVLKQGVEAYQTGRFAEAAQAFRNSAAEQPAAGTLVNLGMTEWRRGRTGAAILAWEQALWVDVFNERAQNNLRFAREMAGLDPPRLTWYETASTWLPTNSWAWIAGAGLWLALGMVTLPVVFRWGRAGWHQSLAALGLGVFLLSLPAHFGVVTRSRIGFVLDRKTPLRLTPTEEAESLTTLVAGEPARLVRLQGDYAFIRTQNGAGWIEREKFGLICPQ